MTTKNQLNSPPCPSPTQADKIGDMAYEALKTNMPLYLVRGMTKEQMDVLYAQGYYFYSQAKYKEALPLFKALTFYHYLDQRRWCLHPLKQRDLLFPALGKEAFLWNLKDCLNLKKFD